MPSRSDHSDKPAPADRSIRLFAISDTQSVISLWKACGLTRPWNDPQRDIERRRAIEDDLFLVVTAPARVERIIGSAMGGYDGHRGWVYYVAVHPDAQGSGLARALMQELERRLIARGCPKINLQVRDDNEAAIAFYRHLGYAVDATTSLGKRLISDA